MLTWQDGGLMVRETYEILRILVGLWQDCDQISHKLLVLEDLHDCMVFDLSERQQGLESFDWLTMMVELVSSIWVLCCKTIVVCVVIVIHGNRERERERERERGLTKTKQSWKCKRSSEAAIRGSLTTAISTLSLTISSTNGHISL